MISSEAWLQLLRQHRIFAVIRSDRQERALQMARASAEGGMRLLEITWNTEGVRSAIETLRSQLPDCIVGTGTLLSAREAKEAIAAGAQFLFSPHVDREIVRVARDAGIPVVPGALSPTEIVTAWQAGASCVKVFPVAAAGGARYIRSLQGPLGQIPLIPTGGVTPENCQDFFQAGAIAAGMAGKLFPANTTPDEWKAIARSLVLQLKAYPI